MVVILVYCWPMRRMHLCYEYKYHIHNSYAYILFYSPMRLITIYLIQKFKWMELKDPFLSLFKSIGYNESAFYSFICHFQFLFHLFTLEILLWMISADMNKCKRCNRRKSTFLRNAKGQATTNNSRQNWLRRHDFIILYLSCVTFSL